MTNSSELSFFFFVEKSAKKKTFVPQEGVKLQIHPSGSMRFSVDQAYQKMNLQLQETTLKE